MPESYAALPDDQSLPTVNETGLALHRFAAELYPLFRSITGAGVRETLRRIQARIPIEIVAVPTGTRVLDWEVPSEWTVRAARIETLDGRVIVDVARSNLHLLHYSRAIDRVVPLDELKKHLFTLPDRPDLIPYRTAYYAETWGFCLADRVAQGLTEPAYRVLIDADVAPGVLNYGEYFLPGRSEREFLFSVHCCHPSLANDNLSGIAIATELARRLGSRPDRRLGYRFLFVPGTIGSISWLAANRETCQRISHGLVLTCVGDPARLTYKVTEAGDAPIDRIVRHVLKRHDGRFEAFVPWGYDERQYNSPGFRLPVGCLMRSPHGTFPEYHTSADNLDFITPAAMVDTLDRLEEIVAVAERDETLLNLEPYAEPQLGRRGLYRTIGGLPGAGAGGAGFDALAMLWVLNQSDGTHSLLDIAERCGKPFAEIRAAADALVAAKLLGPA